MIASEREAARTLGGYPGRTACTGARHWEIANDLAAIWTSLASEPAATGADREYHGPATKATRPADGNRVAIAGTEPPPICGHGFPT